MSLYMNIARKSHRNWFKKQQILQTSVRRLLGIGIEAEDHLIITLKKDFPLEVYEYFIKLEDDFKKTLFHCEYDSDKLKTTVVACTGKKLVVSCKNKIGGNDSRLYNTGVSESMPNMPTNYKPYMYDNLPEK